MSRRLVMLAPFGLRPKSTLAQRMLPLAAALTNRGWSCSIVAPAYLHLADAGSTEVIDRVTIETNGRPPITEAKGRVHLANIALLVCFAGGHNRPARVGYEVLLNREWKRTHQGRSRNYAAAKYQEFDSVSSRGVVGPGHYPNTQPYKHRRRLISPRTPSIHQY